MSRLRALASALLLLLCVAACSQADDRMIELEESLSRAGFEHPFVDYADHGDQGLALLVDFDSSASTAPAIESEAVKAARTVWENGRMRVAKIDVYATYDEQVDVPATFSWNDDQLRERFGPRPAGLDVLVSMDGGVSPGVVIPWLVVGLLVVAFVVVLLVVRHRRRRRPTTGWTEYLPLGTGSAYGYGYGGPYGSGAPTEPWATPPEAGSPQGDVWAPPTGR
jgi:hypothetical protein